MRIIHTWYTQRLAKVVVTFFNIFQTEWLPTGNGNGRKYGVTTDWQWKWPKIFVFKGETLQLLLLLLVTSQQTKIVRCIPAESFTYFMFKSQVIYLNCRPPWKQNLQKKSSQNGWQCLRVVWKSMTRSLVMR